MTLILTCATRRAIVQVSDRRLTRLDGSLYDDDTTKAVFYCGRVAVGYSGDAFIAGYETGEWLSRQLTSHANLEEALHGAARAFEAEVAKQSGRRPQLAIVASGWATDRGTGKPKPFVATLSNCLEDDGTWLPHANLATRLRLEWLEDGRSHLLVATGQVLRQRERSVLDEAVRDALRSRSEPMGLAAPLGELIRALSDDGSERGRRIGKGLIIQALAREAVLGQGGRLAGIVSPLVAGANSAMHVASDGSADRWLSPWIACGGGVFIGGGGPAGGPGSMTAQIDAQARSVPIVIPTGQSRVRVDCPFCAKEGEQTPVEASLDQGESERRIYCDRGHPLHVMRS